jgi:MFS family permease
MECTFEYFVALLVADVYLANVLSYIGMSDAMAGIVSSFISLAFVFQILTVGLIKKMKNTKLTVIVFHSLGQFCFMFLYLIPLISMPTALKHALTMAIILLAYFGNYIVHSIMYKWGNSYVRPTGRASFSATKEMISLACGMILTFVVGQIIDRYNKTGDKEGGFLFLAIGILIFCICDFVCILLIKNEPKHVSEELELVPIKTTLASLFRNKAYVYIVILDCMFKSSIYITNGFLGVYKTNTLLISVGTAQIINILGCFARFVFSKPIGRFSDKTSYASGIVLGLSLYLLGYICLCFTSPSTWWMIILMTIFTNVGAAGASANLFNCTYNYVDDSELVQAMAIKSCLAGVVGFSVTFVGAKILSFVQENNDTLFGVHIYGQQVLAILSCLLFSATILFAELVVKKQKRTIR